MSRAHTATSTAFVVVRSVASGREWRVEHGVEARLSRDTTADVPLVHQRVSRAAHARLAWEGAHAFLVEDGAGHAMYVHGDRCHSVPVEARVAVRLGSADDGEDLELEMVRPAPPVPIPQAEQASYAPRHRAPAVGTEDGADTDGTAASPVRVTDPALTHLGHVLGQPPSAPPASSATSGPALVLSWGSTTLTVRGVPDRVYTLGRAEDSDLVVDEPRVSRRHLEVAWDGAGWVMTDRSTRGTFGPDGRPLPTGQPVPVTDTATVRLGDPADGETATLSVAGRTNPQPAHAVRAAQAVRAALSGLNAPRPAPLVAMAALLLALIASAMAVVHVAAARSGLSAGDLANVERSVVRLTMMSDRGSSEGWGSGTIVSPDGLILTNAHVADPTAHGLAQYGFDSRRAAAEPVKYLLVGVDSGQGRPVRDRYRAHVVVVDGLVDLAVVKIYANADGSPLTGRPDLPALPIGDSDTVQAGDQLTVLGFPGAADSSSVTVNSGEVAGLSRDPHMDSNRAFFDSSATVRHGNSGGTAVDAAGELIGVPTRLATSDGDVSYRVRPVDFARPLLAKARAGGDPGYVSPYLVTPTGHEHVRFLGVTDQASKVCTDKAGTTLPSGTTHFWSAFVVTGAARHLDLFPLVGQDRSGTFRPLFSAGPWTATGKALCLYTEVDPGTALPDGSYQAEMLAGPDADTVLGEAASFTVGTSSTGGTTGSSTDGSASAADTLHQAFPGTLTAEWACAPSSGNPTGATYGEKCKFPADGAVTTDFYAWSSVEAENLFLESVRRYVPGHGTVLSDGAWSVDDTKCGVMLTVRWSDTGSVTMFGFYSGAPYSFAVSAPTEKQALAVFQSEAFPLSTPDKLPTPSA